MNIYKSWSNEDVLRLTCIKGLNSANTFKIVESFESFSDFCTAASSGNFVPGLLQKRIFDNNTFEFSHDADLQLDICRNKAYSIVSYWDPAYPVLLKSITYPPVLLFVWGTLQKRDAVSVSIVGTRHHTIYGKISAELFSSYFANRGIVVTSGLAYGIDTIAHNAALAAGGITYAVVASGLDCINPDTSDKNARNIVDSGGAILSEYKCNIKALPPYFPQRNRIISGISKATIIVESAFKGGSLITASFAFDQGREVYAIPGNISSEKSLGTNLLIKKNIANIAVSPEFVFEDLGLAKDSKDSLFARTPVVYHDSTEKKIHESLSFEPKHIDDIASELLIDLPLLLAKLLDMEFKGIVRQLPGKYYIKSFE